VPTPAFFSAAKLAALLLPVSFAGLGALAAHSHNSETTTAVPTLARTKAPSAEADSAHGFAPVDARDAAQGGGRREVSSLRVTIRPTGFEPAEVRLPAGSVLLTVANRSGLREVALRWDVEGDGGGTLHRARMTLEQLDWRGAAFLTPGVYVLTETAHPEWKCRITVAPR
jgi:hypothetical protein